MVEQEVTDYLERGHYQRRRPEQEHRGHRNGYEPGRIRTAEGEIVVQVPQVRDAPETYRSRLMVFLRANSDVLERLAVEMYARGLSTRDIEDALEEATGDRLLAAGPLTFGWDENGNTTGKGSATYDFNALDRLTEVVSGTMTVQFGYNGDGVRVRKTINGAGTHYIQDVAAPLTMVLAETTGGETNRYVYGNDLLAQVDPAGDPTFYHADGLGSTRALSNLSGQRTDAYGYDVFGAVRSQIGDSSQSFTFTGEQVDGELGLMFLRARYFDPQIGRFFSADTFPGSDLLTQTWNRYTYVQNSPAMHEDRDGHFWNFVAGAAAGVLEYTVKVGVQNALEGRPLSQALNGWDPGQAAISGAKGAVVYGLGLGPVGGALVTGVAHTAGSALRQYQTSGTVDIKQAAAEGVVGGVLSYGVGKVFGYPHLYVRGSLPTGKYMQTALFGAHARQKCFRAVFRGVVRAPIKNRFKELFFPPSVYASDYDFNAIYGTWGSPSSSMGADGWSTSLPGGDK
jgi:RHS repeat-associated protein